MKNEDTAGGALLLRGARIVLPDEVLEGAAVLVEGGRIVEVSRDALTAGGRELDLEGLTLYPGFVDIHIHGAVGVDTLDTDADGLHKVARFLASRGVTAWLPTL